MEDGLPMETSHSGIIFGECLKAAPGRTRPVEVGTLWGLTGQMLAKTAQYGESGGSVVSIKTIGYKR
jgi:hypothetical protein